MANISALRSPGRRSRIRDTNNFNASCTAPMTSAPGIEAQRANVPSSSSMVPQSNFSGLESGVATAVEEEGVVGLDDDQQTVGWQICGKGRPAGGEVVVASEDWSGGEDEWVTAAADEANREGCMGTMAYEASSEGGGARSLSHHSQCGTGAGTRLCSWRSSTKNWLQRGTRPSTSASRLLQSNSTARGLARYTMRAGRGERERFTWFSGRRRVWRLGSGMPCKEGGYGGGRSVA
jgi:hypothetical protein